ncbi:MAG TPA: M15 family metallopeptidase [Deltaproteobacteria bacterium]|nr:M15 family metallopeptidase [Deltaproteobacteria bacterium]
MVVFLLVTVLSSSSAAADRTAERAWYYIMAYPEHFVAFQDGHLITARGTRIRFDDGLAKDCETMVRDPSVRDDDFDPEDALHWEYPAGTPLPTAAHPPAGEPGRIRPRAVFEYLYGATPQERRGNMRAIVWVGSSRGSENTIRVTTACGVDKALERVVCRIRSLPQERKKALRGIVLKTGGYSGYHERTVRDFPGRTSAHAYGIAVDINWDESYYIGSRRAESYRYRNNVPKFLVDIFEENGFIWGGRWHSYDAMHFEYRPELLLMRGARAGQGGELVSRGQAPTP